jgi:hypothetical protein
MKRRAPLVLAVVAAVTVAGCVGGGGGGGGEANEIGPDDPIGQMNETFDGTSDRAELQQEVDLILQSYDVEPSDENRSELGNIVLDVAEDSLVTSEMDVVTCMSNVDPEEEEVEGETKMDKIRSVAEFCAA